MNSQRFFDDIKQRLESWLDEALPQNDPDVAPLLKSARYSTLAGGKRFRGSVVLAMADWLGEDRSMLALAGGVEMIHAYSLIHDDLPAMDDDDLRRGKPTNHIMFGEATAILAGDYLLSDAHRLIIHGLKKSGFESDRILLVMEYLGEVLGAVGMVGGQEMDMALTGKPMSLPVLEKIHRLKTGRFIEFAFVAPLLLSRGISSPEPDFDLSAFALKLGLLFQVVDDILDVTAEEDVLGKPVGSDMQNHKSTYVSLLGLEQAKQVAQTLEDELLHALSPLTELVLKRGLSAWVDQVAHRDR